MKRASNTHMNCFESSDERIFQLTNIVEKVPNHVYWKDLDGRYLGCNQQFANTLQLSSPLQIIGKTDKDLLTLEKAVDIQHNDQKIFNNGVKQIFEEQAVDKNGRPAIYLTTKTPMRNITGKVIGLLGISIDITERKIAEEELKAANARIKAMAGSIAHELRMPLGCIGMNLGCIETMTTDPSEENCEAAKESLGEIRKELESANTIINMLLMNIREQLDWQKEKMEVCSINECVEEALRRYPFVEDQRSKVSWKKSRQDFSFKGNAIFMQHVIFNLLKNALLQIKKAGKGEITIWTEKESGTAKETSTEKESEGFSLHFKDTASGVSKDILPHLFERFFSRTKNGTGLGLAFCKMVIESFGGTISCDSEEGTYMEFKIRLPNANK